MAHWRVYKYWKVGSQLVTFQVDVVDTFQDALHWASDHHITPNKNMGRFLFKMEGHKKRIYNQKDYNYWYSRWAKQEEPPEKETIEPQPIPLPPPKEPEHKQQSLWDITEVWINKPKEKRRL